MSRFHEVVDIAAEANEEIVLNTTDGLSSIAMVLVSKVLAISGKVISYDKYAPCRGEPLLSP
ncbi:MAG TPA: hypothetical protein EYP59_11940 [Thiotrichaceae bacterium]|nr:hypothetical protein [Thiotrichaceae bacterium]